jgi:hypothetical protein
MSTVESGTQRVWLGGRHAVTVPGSLDHLFHRSLRSRCTAMLAACGPRRVLHERHVALLPLSCTLRNRLTTNKSSAVTWFSTNEDNFEGGNKKRDNDENPGPCCERRCCVWFVCDCIGCRCQTPTRILRVLRLRSGVSREGPMRIPSTLRTRRLRAPTITRACRTFSLDREVDVLS